MPLARKLNLTFSPGLYERISQYARAHEMKEFEAIKELVETGLSGNPVEQTVIASKRRGFEQARRWCMTKVAEQMKEIASQAEREIGIQKMY